MAGGGFGFGSFGSNPFGRDAWAKRVLYASAPVIYREADTAEGSLLEKYAEGQEESFEQLRELIQRYGDIRDPLIARTAYSDSQFVVLGKQVVSLGPVEQAGFLGQVTVVGSFTVGDRTASFTQKDIGKNILIKRSNVAANNLLTLTITTVVNEKTVLTDPQTTLDYPSASSTPMRWELRSPAPVTAGQCEIELRGGDPRLIQIGSYINDGTNDYEVLTRQIFWQSVSSNQLLTEREGSDGAIDSQGRLSSSTYTFQYGDVGKWVSIDNSSIAGNDGLYEIEDVESGKAVFSQLTVLGADNNDVFGRVAFSYKPLVSKRVSIEMVYENLPSLALQVTRTQVQPSFFNVRIRLATDISGYITTVPSDIATAIAADLLISPYIEAVAFFPTSTTPVGVLPQTVLKSRQPAEDVGPLYWAIRPFARVTLKGSVPLGVVDGEGYDLSVISDDRVSAASAPFLAKDLGKLLTIGGSSLGNNGVYLIQDVLSPTDVRLKSYLNTAAATVPLYWCRRTAPVTLEDPTRLNPLDYEVRSYAEPLLDYLAYDFGLKVDRQQTDVRQRAWIKQSSQWMASKGTKLSIEQVAILNGFSAEVEQLYSATARPAMGDATHPLPYDIFYLAYPLRATGTSGTLTRTGGIVHYTDTAALFEPSDAGKVLSITGGFVAGNNTVFVIDTVVSAYEVTLLEPSIGATFGSPVSVTLPDSLNGTLNCSIGEIFTDILPEFPASDDVEWDTLAELYDDAGYDVNDRPGLDFPCHGRVTLTPVKDPNNAPVDEVPIRLGYFAATQPTALDVPNIVSINPAYGLKITAIATTGTTHTLTIEGEDLRLVLGGEWKLYDSNGTEYYFNTAPTNVTETPTWTWTVPVTAYSPPATGEVNVEYQCPASSASCDNCPTYRLIIRLTAEQVLEEGDIATENMYDRCVERIKEVLPIEAEVYWVYLS